MRHYFFILLLFLSAGLFAREPRFVNYGPDDGLTSLSVYAIAQDADGALWIGTRGGLFRFDGKLFEAFNDDLPALRVTSLAVDAGNRLWVGTTAGISVIAGKHRQSLLQGHYVRALCTDGDGLVWAATKDSLLVRLGMEGADVLEYARLRYHIGDFEGDYPVQDLLADSSGRLWVGGRLVAAQIIEDIAAPPEEATIVEGWWNVGSYTFFDGHIWAFDDYYSDILRYDDPAQTFVDLGRIPVAHAALLGDSRGRLWAAGSYGLCLVDTGNPSASTVYKPASNELYCIFEDRQGNIWVGGDNGLSVLSPALQQVNTVSTAQVSALMEDSGGKLWTGTREERISCFYEDRSGAVYVGYWNNTGFDIFRGGKKSHGKISGPLPQEQWVVAYGDRVTSNWIADFLEGSDGRFWVVTWEGAGLNEWDRATGRTLPPQWLSPFKYPSPGKDSTIYLSSRLGSRLTEDAYGNLVYGTTEAGVNIIDKDTQLVTKYFRGNSGIPDDYVTDLCLAPDGAVWVATQGGLWKCPGSGGSGEKSLLPGKLVQSVEADAAGRLWAGTEEGLYFMDTDGSIGRIPRELGFPSDIYGEHVSCSLHDGSLAFGGPSGAVRFHPDSLLAIDARGNLPLVPLVQHRHRLNGGEWVNGEFAALPDNMRPGHYLLEEQSSDIFGRWERGETVSRTIRVPLPLWLRWPFLLLYALALGAVVWTFIRLRERRLLMKELDMRNRLFSIISHDLRNPVSANRLLAHQLLSRMDDLPPEKLREGLDSLAQSTDNTASLLENLLLWSLNQKGMLKPVMREQNLLPLVNEAVESIHGKEIVRADIPESLVVRTDRNMMLTVLRNLLDNAVKASPEGAKVVLKASERRISILDEGPGIREKAAGWGHGLGLVITRELLEKMGAEMNMANRPEGGLEITINL